MASVFIPSNIIQNYFKLFDVLYLGILRSKVRGTYKIEGTVIEDCFCSYFCPVNNFFISF